MSGTKAVLVARLSNAEKTSRFTHECAAPRFFMSDFDFAYSYDLGDEMKPIGISTEQLKSECRNKGLVVGGNKFDLVLRLLQHETSDQTGIEPKKAQGTFDDKTGEFKPKPRAKSMQLPDPEKLGERMKKKAYPTKKEQSKWGNNKFKYHAESCINLCNELLQKEVVEKELFSRGKEERAWQVVLQLVRYWLYQDGIIGHYGFGNDIVTGMSRAGSSLGDLFQTLIKFLDATKDMGKLVEMKIDRLLRDLREHASAYGGTYGNQEADFEAAINKHFPPDKEEEE